MGTALTTDEQKSSRLVPILTEKFDGGEKNSAWQRGMAVQLQLRSKETIDRMGRAESHVGWCGGLDKCHAASRPNARPNERCDVRAESQQCADRTQPAGVSERPTGAYKRSPGRLSPLVVETPQTHIGRTPPTAIIVVRNGPINIPARVTLTRRKGSDDIYFGRPTTSAALMLQTIMVLMEKQNTTIDVTNFPSNINEDVELERCYSIYGCFSKAYPWTENRPDNYFPEPPETMHIRRIRLNRLPLLSRSMWVTDNATAVRWSYLGAPNVRDPPPIIIFPDSAGGLSVT
ncbi:hypothetical protein EVAR_95007_1 [Eumeta japonica]|uniref:Uncharacterized protein n=1 Tax=Eumeta variegata TaxID=151549 RepID=A0A4C1VSC4_EUMVA|nr:hypothetical protein EVAR_95007_1 [Eumeta japonica]